MKWSILLFIILALALSAGTSYLALTEKFKREDIQRTSKMAIALVNEDAGALFEGEKISFGDQFVKSVGKDNKHQWNVVSRGVAENGLKNNSYNLMIVIPNDFSSKAVSIHSEYPEKVTLNYKINASGNDDLKLEAEKAAAAIVEDVNSRVIDVYFASIIGQLQTAQNNIGTIIKKEQEHMNAYQKDVHNPLASYTNQFQSVQNYTDGLVNNFGGFQDVLKTFDQTIDGSSQSNASLVDNFGNLQKTKEAGDVVTGGFTNKLNDFTTSMSAEDVLKHLSVLESTNKMIASQFDSTNEQANILSDSLAVQQYLKDVNSKINDYDVELAEKLNSDIQEVLYEKLKKTLSNDNEKEIYVSNFMQQPNNQIKKHIEEAIKKLPSVDLEEMDELEVSAETKVQLKNVIEVTKKYGKENDFDYEKDGDIPIGESVERIKEKLANDGIVFKSAETIQKMNSPQTFQLYLPDYFGLHWSSGSLTINGKDYTTEFLNNGYVTLPAQEAGKLKVHARVKLLDVKANIDVLAPVTWKWSLTHSDEQVVTSTTSETNQVNEAVQKEQVSTNVEDESSGNVTNEERKEENATTGADETVQQEAANEKDVEQPKKEQQTVVQTNVEKQTIERTNNKIIFEKEERLYSNSSEEEVSDLQYYQQLLSLYGLYYGFDMQSPNLTSQLEAGTLHDIATTDSLYHMLIKQDVIELLAGVVSSEIHAEVTADTKALKQKVEEYKKLVDEADKNSEHLTQVLNETTAQAKSMNESLSEYLKALATWRESSLDLMKEQQNVVSSRQEEQTAVLQLNSEASSLFTQSQALAQQSERSLSNSESVYDTFDRINNQAKEIESSGVTIVSKADTLLKNLTKKLDDDQKFSKNFTKVLANSRIGDRPNENLYQFLANPIEKQNAGIIVAGDAFTPYLIVLVCFIVALFTAYVIANYDKQRKQTDDFEEELSLIAMNFPITAVAFGISIVEGVIIGLVSAHLLEFGNSQTLIWISFITTVMASFIFIASYLLRQAKMIGMFILLLCFSMYLFLTDAVGNATTKVSSIGKWQQFSPLQYVEEFFNDFMSGKTGDHMIFISILVIAIVGFIANLLVLRKEKKEVELDEQTMEISG
ncbi:type VII secretion protein EsaA [Bacillus manliponensis]|nr:type VII secretion protein EsaA [Bacillus manliponensis]